MRIEEIIRGVTSRNDRTNGAAAAADAVDKGLRTKVDATMNDDILLCGIGSFVGISLFGKTAEGGMTSYLNFNLELLCSEKLLQVV